MAAPDGTVVRVGRALERFVESRHATPTVLVVSLVVYAAVSVALPLHAGRDLSRYLLMYAQLADAHVVYPHGMLTRTPVTPVVAGALLDAGTIVAEFGAALLYAFSVVAWFSVARRFGGTAAVATAVALLLYPGYVILFHALSSDALFAAGFALVALLFARLLDGRTPARAAALGAGVALLVLVRPVAQVLLLFILAPLLAPGSRHRGRGVVAFAVAAALPLLGWSVHNQVRFDDLTIARGGGVTFPLFRAFVADRIVEPENGPASRELARVVARDLLPYEPYRSYGIDLKEFFGSGSSRMHDDLTMLGDRTWGWDDDYRHLARVGREAVFAHPTVYARGVAEDVGRLLLWPLYPPAPRDDAPAAPASAAAPAPAPAAAPAPAPAAAPAHNGGLPTPSEGQPIPSAREAPYLSTPTGRNREVWTSATEHHVEFGDPDDVARAAALDRRLAELLDAFPDRDARTSLVSLLDHASRWYPRPFAWLLLGLVAMAWRRPARYGLTLTLAGAALVVILVTSLAVYAVAEYAVPVVPAFVLLTTAGLFGRRAA